MSSSMVRSVWIAIGTLLITGLVVAVIAFAGGSGGTTSQGPGNAAPTTHTEGTHPETPPPAATRKAPAGTPQGNGGDSDPDNNGGPDDGDGAV
jgi:hypothetical protein